MRSRGADRPEDADQRSQQPGRARRLFGRGKQQQPAPEPEPVSGEELGWLDDLRTAKEQRAAIGPGTQEGEAKTSKSGRTAPGPRDDEREESPRSAAAPRVPADQALPDQAPVVGAAPGAPAPRPGPAAAPTPGPAPTSRPAAPPGPAPTSRPAAPPGPAATRGAVPPPGLTPTTGPVPTPGPRAARPVQGPSAAATPPPIDGPSSASARAAAAVPPVSWEPPRAAAAVPPVGRDHASARAAAAVPPVSWEPPRAAAAVPPVERDQPSARAAAAVPPAAAVRPVSPVAPAAPFTGPMPPAGRAPTTAPQDRGGAPQDRGGAKGFEQASAPPPRRAAADLPVRSTPPRDGAAPPAPRVAREPGARRAAEQPTGGVPVAGRPRSWHEDSGQHPLTTGGWTPVEPSPSRHAAPDEPGAQAGGRHLSGPVAGRWDGAFRDAGHAGSTAGFGGDGQAGSRRGAPAPGPRPPGVVPRSGNAPQVPTGHARPAPAGHARPEPAESGAAAETYRSDLPRRGHAEPDWFAATTAASPPDGTPARLDPTGRERSFGHAEHSAAREERSFDQAERSFGPAGHPPIRPEHPGAPGGAGRRSAEQAGGRASHRPSPPNAPVADTGERVRPPTASGSAVVPPIVPGRHGARPPALPGRAGAMAGSVPATGVARRPEDPAERANVGTAAVGRAAGAVPAPGTVSGAAAVGRATGAVAAARVPRPADPERAAGSVPVPPASARVPAAPAPVAPPAVGRGPAAERPSPARDRDDDDPSASAPQATPGSSSPGTGSPTSPADAVEGAQLTGAPDADAEGGLGAALSRARRKLREQRRLRMITLSVLSLVVLAALPLFFGLRAVSRDPVFTSLDALSVPAWAAQNVDDRSSGSRWCIIECRFRERIAQSDRPFAETATTYEKALTAAGWRPWQVAHCPDRPVNEATAAEQPAEGVYNCWRRDEFTLDLWVRPPTCIADTATAPASSPVADATVTTLNDTTCAGSSISIKVQHAVSDRRGGTEPQIDPSLVGETPDVGPVGEPLQQATPATS